MVNIQAQVKLNYLVSNIQMIYSKVISII